MADSLATPGDSYLLSPRALLPDGATLVLRHSPTAPEKEHLIVLDERLRERSVVAMTTPVERDARYSYFHRFSDGNVRGGIFPYAPLPRQRVSADGSLVANVATTVESPRGGHLIVTLVSAAGDTLLARRIPFAGVAMVRADATRAIAAAYERMLRPMGSIGPEQSREAADAWRRRVVVPAAYPPVEDVLVGSDSTAWLQVRQSGNRVHFLGVQAHRSQVFETHLPAGSRLLAANADELWVAETDSLGVPSLVRYRLDLSRRGEGLTARR